jgi:hypothetical protein
MEILETELIALRQETEELRSFKEFVCERDKFFASKYEESQQQ